MRNVSAAWRLHHRNGQHEPTGWMARPRVQLDSMVVDSFWVGDRIVTEYPWPRKKLVVSKQALIKIRSEVKREREKRLCAMEEEKIRCKGRESGETLEICKED